MRIVIRKPPQSFEPRREHSFGFAKLLIEYDTRGRIDYLDLRPQQHISSSIEELNATLLKSGTTGDGPLSEIKDLKRCRVYRDRRDFKTFACQVEKRRRYFEGNQSFVVEVDRRFQIPLEAVVSSCHCVRLIRLRKRGCRKG